MPSPPLRKARSIGSVPRKYDTLPIKPRCPSCVYDAPQRLSASVEPFIPTGKVAGVYPESESEWLVHGAKTGVGNLPICKLPFPCDKPLQAPHI